MIMIILLKPLLLQILLLYIIIELFHILYSICLQLILNYIILYCLTIQTLICACHFSFVFLLLYSLYLFNVPFATF